jgi:phosphatidylglycerophosphate synthase
MKVKAVVIMVAIILSLLPVYLANKYLQKIINPGDSLKKFLLYLAVVFALIFLYTFLLVFIIRLIFPDA